MTKKCIFYILFMLPFAAVAQKPEVLGLEEAISTTLENNYSIRLERYNEEMSENRVSHGLSGQMPRLEVGGSYERGYAEAETQTLNLGAGGEGTAPPLELEGSSETLQLQPQVTINLFSGFSGRYRYRQLKNAHHMSELQVHGTIEQAVAQTISAYLEVARLQSRLNVDEDNIAISHDRWLRVTEAAKYGAANSVRRLQAEVDLKTDSANYRNTMLAYENSRRRLKLQMGESPDSDYRVQETLLLTDRLAYDDLLADMKAANTRLSISRSAIDNARYEQRIAEANYYPTVQGYANYTYLDTEDEASFIQSNQVYGPSAGVRLSWAVFTGGANKIERQNAHLQREQQETALQQTQLTLETELQNVYAEYINNREQLRIEESNLQTFQRNYDKIYEDYKLGLVDAADLRTAQLNLSAAKNRINSLTYSVKQSEVRLMQLSGRLVEK